jgi:hypothetical protein
MIWSGLYSLELTVLILHCMETAITLHLLRVMSMFVGGAEAQDSRFSYTPPLPSYTVCTAVQ